MFSHRFLILFVDFFLLQWAFCEFCYQNNRTDFYRSKSGQCLSCLTFCNGRTDVCLHVQQLEHLCSTIYLTRNIRECEDKIDRSVVRQFLLLNHSNGNDFSLDQIDEPVCLFCGSSTRGRRCESCRQRPNGKQLSSLVELKSPTSTCFDCFCSGQNYDCQTNVTDGCLCLTFLLDVNQIESNLNQCLSNRTFNNENEQNQCRTKISQQCNSCKRGYTGVATERGHRCYKLLSTDSLHCFEYPNSIRSCWNGNEMIRTDDNRTISFEITPSYRNLNIRVLIGIEFGFADVICSVRNANFLVLTDNRVYYEFQSLITEEPNFREFNLTDEDLNFGIFYSNPTDIIIVRNLSFEHRLTILVSSNQIDFSQENFRCLIVDRPTQEVRSDDLFDPKFPPSSKFSLSDYRAIHLSTSSARISSSTNGFIRIYQSRMNIDLFVFFSVFFSSFFLFLSIGICFWKVKFAYELHRRRRTIKHEYHKRMARPFAKIQLLIKPSKIFSQNDEKSVEQLASPTITSSVDIPLLLPSTRTDIDYSSHVIAVEPLRDQNTCYTTLLFHLPGDLSTQYRLCAGTTLTQIPTDYANALVNARHEAELQKRNRRRKRYHRKNRHRSKVLLKKTTTTTTTTTTTITNSSSITTNRSSQSATQQSNQQQIQRRRKLNRRPTTTMTSGQS